MPKVIIDGQEIEIENGMTVLQACEKAGREIPVFCYHERLSIAGNCRMCLVEVEKMPKLAASCALPAADGMVIHTKTEKVKNARNGVLEFLLINHPLDCPICDQGGECDLQDITMSYGRGTSRFELNKRAVPEKHMGPLIKTEMTRCIHCTRCVRFATEIAGVPEMGALYRGEHMEITSYLEGAVTSELSGNMIDICPVGALTSKPYAYQGRPWELVKTDTIDVLDAVGSAIRVDSRGREVMRVLPRVNDDINEEWISDKTRFAIDGLKYQRLDRPYVRKKNKLVECSWADAIQAVTKALTSCDPSEIGVIAGNMVDVESTFVMRQLLDEIGCMNRDCRQDGAQLPHKNRSDYLFNTTIAGIEQADVALLIGTNPRWEAPIINARLRKAYVQNGLTVAMISPKIDLSYPVDHIGDCPKDLEKIIAGKHDLAKKLKNAKNPMIILGQAVFTHPNMQAILHAVGQLCEKYKIVRDDWNGYNVLHTAAGRVGALDVGFVPGAKGKSTIEILKGAKNGTIKVVYLNGADEIDTSLLGDAFVIYQGHHGDKGAHCADVILPGCSYMEKNGFYVNTQGLVQEAFQAIEPPGQAMQDWQIVKLIWQEWANKNKKYAPNYLNSLNEIRHELQTSHPIFAKPNSGAGVEGKFVFPKTSSKDLTDKPFVLPIDNFYMTDVISRHSKTMAQCLQDIVNKGSENNNLKDGGHHDR